MNTTTRHEAQIDTEIAAAWTAYAEQALRLEVLTDRVRKYAATTATAKRLTAEAATLEPVVDALRKTYEAADDKYAGWSRFFLVQGGHIHRSMNCSTCNRNGSLTQFGWLPELSGLTEAAAVEAHGAILCTVCFPSAPVEWTNAFEEAAKAKAAARCAGSGSFLNRDLPHRTGYYSGNYGTCEVCGDRPAVTSTGKLRAHKPKG